MFMCSHCCSTFFFTWYKQMALYLNLLCPRLNSYCNACNMMHLKLNKDGNWIRYCCVAPVTSTAPVRSCCSTMRAATAAAGLGRMPIRAWYSRPCFATEEGPRKPTKRITTSGCCWRVPAVMAYDIFAAVLDPMRKRTFLVSYTRHMKEHTGPGRVVIRKAACWVENFYTFPFTHFKWNWLECKHIQLIAVKCTCKSIK